MNQGSEKNWARQPLFPDIPDRTQIQQFDYEGAKVDTVPSMARPGDVVLPVEVAQFNPALVHAIQKVIAQHGADPSAYIAGSASGNYNPHTGQQHFFLKKLLKPLVKIAAPVVGFALGGPVGAAVASGVATKATGGSTKEALLSAGGSFIGAGGIGGAASGAAGQTIGQAVAAPSTGFGSSIVNAGKSAVSSGLNMLPTSAANALRLVPMSAAVGGIQGAMLGSGVGQAIEMADLQKRQQAELMAQYQNAFNNIQAGPVNLPGGVAAGFLPFNQQANQRTVNYSNQLPTGAVPAPGPSGVEYFDRVKDRDTGTYSFRPGASSTGSFSSNLNSAFRRQGFGGVVEYV